jgi:hypothetical protein
MPHLAPRGPTEVPAVDHNPHQYTSHRFVPPLCALGEVRILQLGVIVWKTDTVALRL